MADQILTAVDKRTGARVKFHWTGTGSPQKADLDQIFADQHAAAKAAVNKAGTDFDAAHPGATDVGPVGQLGDVAERALTGVGKSFGINRDASPSTSVDTRSGYQKMHDKPNIYPWDIPIEAAKGLWGQAKGLYNDISSGNYAGAAGRGIGLGVQAGIGRAMGGPETALIEPEPQGLLGGPPPEPEPQAAPEGPPGPTEKPVSNPIIDADFEDIPNAPEPTRSQLGAPSVAGELPPAPGQVAAPAIPQTVPQLTSAETSPSYYQGGSSIPPEATTETPLRPVASPVTSEAPPPATVEPIKLPRRGSKTPIGNPPVETPPTATVVPENIPQPPQGPPFEVPETPPPATVYHENFPDTRPGDVAAPPPVTVNPENMPMPDLSDVQTGTVNGRPVSLDENGEPVMYNDEPSPTTQIDPNTPQVAGPVESPMPEAAPPQGKAVPQEPIPPEEEPQLPFSNASSVPPTEGALSKGEVPDETPELQDVPPERWKRIDDYFDTLQDIEDNKNVSRLPELAKQAKDLDLAPNKFESDLRMSGIDEPTIDKTLSQAYGNDILKSQADESAGGLSQFLRSLSNDESGELQLSKKNWQSKFPQMMTNPTGLISRPMRFVHGALSSTDQFLDTNPVTKPIADAARNAYFGPQGEQAFKSDVLGKFNEIHRSLSKGQLVDLHDVMEGAPSKDPAVNAAAVKERAIFDYIHRFAESKGVTKASGKSMRYMSDYLTHIMKDDTFGGVATDYLKHLFGNEAAPSLKERLMGSDTAPLKAGQGTDLNQSLGTPRSNFAEARYGTEKPLESDMDTIARRYTESMGRAAFRGPVVKMAAKIIDKMPPGPDKHFAEYYVQKYGGLVPDSPLTAIDKGLARMSARSLLAFSPKLQMLHAIRLVGQGVPELGFENIAKGAHSVLQDPNGAFARAQRYGLIDNVPNKMKSGSEIFDKVANFADLGNNFTKVIMHESNRAKLQGSSPDWETRAAQETSRQEGMVNPTSPNYLLDKLPRLISQYKNYGQKYLENVVRSGLQNDKAGYVKLGRYLGAGLGLYGLSKTTGYALMHLRGRNMLSLSTPQLEFLNNLRDHLSSFSQEDKNGNTGLDKAVMDIMRFAIPGGHEFTKKNEEGELEFKPPSLSDEPTTEDQPEGY